MIKISKVLLFPLCTAMLLSAWPSKPTTAKVAPTTTTAIAEKATAGEDTAISTAEHTAATTATKTEETENTEETKNTVPDKQTKNGLVKEDGYYRYYQDGELVKSRWITIDKKKYYFKKSGNAATFSYKQKGTYYIFNAKGQLSQPKSTKLVKIEAEDGSIKRYIVNPDGTAAKGWTEDKLYYAYETGEVAIGIIAMKEKFYYFTASGKYNTEKTKALRSVAKYEKPFAPVKKIIGKPKKAKYYASCYGDGKDGILTYDRFTVYTYKPTSGAEIFMGVE